MTNHYDALETREPAEREAELFARLPDVLRKAMAAPAYAERLRGIDLAAVTNRAVLAGLPILRKCPCAPAVEGAGELIQHDDERKPRSARIDGSATFTMLWSSTIIRSPRQSTQSASQRDRVSFITCLLGSRAGPARTLVTYSTNGPATSRQVVRHFSR